MKEYIYIGIYSRERIKYKREEYEEILRVIQSYPLIIKLWAQTYKIDTKKPILTRMGKGKGKKIGTYRIINKGELIVEGYIKTELAKETIVGLVNEGIFKKYHHIELRYYLVDSIPL